MNINKLQEAIAELREEAAEYLRLADDLEARIKKSAVGADRPARSGKIKPVFTIRPKGKSKKKLGYLRAAVDVLREQGHEVHITDLVPQVAEKLGKETTRASVESALVRAIKSGKWHVKRTSPGTFAVTQ